MLVLTCKALISWGTSDNAWHCQPHQAGSGLSILRISGAGGEPHIQLTEALTSARPVAAAHTRFVRASPSARRAMAAGLTRPLSGCSPMAVAAPVRPVWACAITPTSATGSCSGPQHCCCATSPARCTHGIVGRDNILWNGGQAHGSSVCTLRYHAVAHDSKRHTAPPSRRKMQEASRLGLQEAPCQSNAGTSACKGGSNPHL